MTAEKVLRGPEGKGVSVMVAASDRPRPRVCLAAAVGADALLIALGTA